MTSFTSTTYHNEHLPIGGGRVDAILSVQAEGTPSANGTRADSAVVLMLDVSGSMRPRNKWIPLSDAAEAAISRIADGVRFAVIAGSDLAEVVYPHRPGMALADAETRAAAISAMDRMRAGGGTAIGQWLLEARDRLAPYDTSIRQAILVTDGHDESETRDELYEATLSCIGVFQCDCRGVGTDWDVATLRWIASSLLGSVDIVADPRDMPADFRSLMARAMDRRAPDVRLRVWTPRGATVTCMKQVSPAVEDLTTQALPVDDGTTDFPTGAWGNEARDYHLAVAVPAQPVGSEMLAARVSVVVDGELVSQSRITATWTDDLAASTQLNPRVAHYTGQIELADAIAAGLSARSRGDVTTATHKLGEAVQRAARSGNDDTLRLLGRVVDVIDATTGTVRLKSAATVADVMTLDTRSTKTVRAVPDP